VVLNRVAAEPLGAAESSRGAANFWIWLVFISKMQLEVPPNLKKLRKAAANQKRLKNTALVYTVLYFINGGRAPTLVLLSRFITGNEPN